MTTLNSTPRADGFRMPAEWEPHSQTWMVWPERPDNWRLGGKPAQAAFTAVAKAIAEFEPVTICVSAGQYENARARLDGSDIRLVEISTDDARHASGRGELPERPVAAGVLRLGLGRRRAQPELVLR